MPGIDRGVMEGALGHIWRLSGLPKTSLEQVSFQADRRTLPSSFHVVEAASATIAASGLAAGELWRLRTGESQQVNVSTRHAEVSFLGEEHLKINGKILSMRHGPVSGLHQCGDGRWVRIHANFPHHEAGALDILKCVRDREAVKAALQNWAAQEFEDAAAERGLVIFMMRTPEEWARHGQAKALAGLELFDIEQIGDAPPEPLRANASAPLSGVRILDLTRVIAGPVCGRTLAGHGAQVLRVSSPRLPRDAMALEIDGGRGKRSAFIDIKDRHGNAHLERLAAEADVFVQGYRPGAIASCGFSPERLAELRPGIVSVSLSAWGHEGPWAGRRGFDSLVQTASGINAAEAAAAGFDGPKPLPCQALDHCSGYLLALGAMAGLYKRATVGGSWRVRVALARTGRWLQSLGRVENGFDEQDATAENVSDLMAHVASEYGNLDVVTHAALLGGTPARTDRAPVPYPYDNPAAAGLPEWR